MKKKIAIFVLLVGLLGFPIIGQAKMLKYNKNLLTFEKDSVKEKKQSSKKTLPLEKGNMIGKELEFEPDEEEENENYLHHPMVILPEIGEKFIYAKSDALVTIIDQRWLNITDNVIMKENDVFEANKFYDYRVYYRIAPNEKRYVSIIDYEEDYPYILGMGLGEAENNGQLMSDAVVIYTGEFVEDLYDLYHPTYANLPVLEATLTNTPPKAPNSNLYTVTSEKWTNKTDNKVMKSTDVFEANKKYEYEATFTTKYYVEYQQEFIDANKEKNYLGGMLEHGEEPFTYRATEAFYFGDSSTLKVSTGAIKIKKNNPPKAGGTLVNPTIEFGEHVDQSRVHINWSLNTGDSSKVINEGYQFKVGDKIDFHLNVPLELGYNYEEDFEVIDENINNNFISGDFWAFDGGSGTYSSSYQILEEGATIGISDQYSGILMPNGGRGLTVFPENEDNNEVTWTSSNPEIATINEYGWVEAVAPGTTTITVTNKKGAQATLTLTVGVPVVSITAPATITVYEGEEKEFDISVNPANATDKEVYYSSSDYQVAGAYRMEDKSLIEGYKEGTATITVTSRSNWDITTTFTVKVIKRPEATGITLNKSTLTLAVDGSETLKATVTPKDADPHAIWISANPSIAKVNRVGKVTGIAPGTTTITAKTTSGKQATCTVKVTSDAVEVESISLDRNEMEIETEDVSQLLVTYNPKNATGKTVTFSSSDPSVASVDNEGVVRGLKVGETTITARTKNGKEASCHVVVKKGSLKVAYKTHVQKEGWQDYKVNGEMAGTSGKALRLEAIKIKLKNQDYTGNILYRTHIQTFGWEKEFKKNDEMSGTSGLAKRLEAIEIKLDGEMADHYDVYYRVHAQKFGWLGWARNGEAAGTAGYAYRLEAIEVVLVPKGEAYEGYGEKEAFSDKYAVATITLNKTTLSLESGDEFQFVATVEPVDATDKTLTWTSTNEDSVVVNKSGKINALAEGVSEIIVRSANGKTAKCTVNVLPPIPGVAYKTHVQTYGWQDYVKNGEMSGTSGEAKRLEAIQIKLKNQDYTGNILYRTHIQTFGWEKEFKKNDEMSGTSGLAKRLEAIEIKLDGEMADHYDVYYRVHAQTFGWLSWAKNGEQAGTAGFAKRLEGIEIVLVEKGKQPPVRDNQNDERPFIEAA